jgi:hypothetical protein
MNWKICGRVRTRAKFEVISIYFTTAKYGDLEGRRIPFVPSDI